MKVNFSTDCAVLVWNTILHLSFKHVLRLHAFFIMSFEYVTMNVYWNLAECIHLSNGNFISGMITRGFARKGLKIYLILITASWVAWDVTEAVWSERNKWKNIISTIWKGTCTLNV